MQQDSPPQLTPHRYSSENNTSHHTLQNPTQQGHSLHRNTQPLRQPNNCLQNKNTCVNTTKPTNETDLIIIQININGISNKIQELQQLIKETNADIIAIQETKLTKSSKSPTIQTTRKSEKIDTKIKEEDS